ncbi:MAG: hypothetical protein H6628_00385 [Calditrichae bacterium]|nr:hypothetical protein [Calditrichota bacterium]MCB9086773.1 hypothetical protein [Calditrichia bacterium]
MHKFFRMLLAGVAGFGLWSCAEHITESADTVFDNLDAGPVGMRATFSAIQDSVFTPTCAVPDCHGGSLPPDLREGAAYANIVDVPTTQNAGFNYIKPGDPENSYLYLKITGDSRIFGDPMPQQGIPLSPAVLDSIRLWIANGAAMNRPAQPQHVSLPTE